MHLEPEPSLEVCLEPGTFTSVSTVKLKYVVFCPIKQTSPSNWKLGPHFALPQKQAGGPGEGGGGGCCLSCWQARQSFQLPENQRICYEFHSLSASKVVSGVTGNSIPSPSFPCQRVPLSRIPGSLTP